MRSSDCLAASLLVLSASAGGALGAGPELGQPISEEEIAAWDISIPPSGEGLPDGSGSAAEGAEVYAAQCASCHGEGGRDGPVDPLVGGEGSLDTAEPVKTVGSFWPYATTLFDYTYRAMPLDAPQSLSPDETYAVTAYILAENGIIERYAEMNAETLPAVEMPNHDGFVSWWPNPPE